MYFDINGQFHLGRTLSVSGSREQAFVYALASASLTQSIAKSCSLGFSTKCSCGRLPNTPPPGEFKWGGCGDDLRYGVLFSRWFADGVFLKRKKKSKKVLMSLHNNRAGRKVGQPLHKIPFKYHPIPSNGTSIVLGRIIANGILMVFECI